ncbi:MAG: ABC transporter permease [Sphingomonadaceae bacterium]|uniref:ABC transporter permease n=1 Tax=Thermaurantiacus sp. TaxID=2820283 RepID=UPI00298F0875|nr:ABC transporter permease [Thermaurantiacus sp.]MCS6986880.1 ABC transporter permease [Sphingomonadaceae bacterium]MDW8415520.1 ABC transporter permease [Thermaurantiacus sp.]
MRGRTDWRREAGPFLALIGLPLAWFLLLILVPLGAVWALSFAINTGVASIEVTGTLANYARTLEPTYLGILLKSLALAGLATLVSLGLGFPVALAIAFAPPPWRTPLLVAVTLPFWTNLLIRTYALMAVLRDEGLVNRVVAALAPDLAPLPLLYHDVAVVVGLVYVHLPFMVLPIFAALDRMDRSLIEASLDLGAGPLATIRHVVLPLAGPGIRAGVLLTFVPALGSYLVPDLLGGPGSQMIANVIERQFRRADDWPFGAALAFVLVYLTLLALALLAPRRPAARA